MPHQEWAGHWHLHAFCYYFLLFLEVKNGRTTCTVTLLCVRPCCRVGVLMLVSMAA
jgi:hypothetical protein